MFGTHTKIRKVPSWPDSKLYYSCNFETMMDDHLITLQIRFIAPPDEWVVVVVCSSDICKICPLQHFPWVFKMKWPRSSNAWPHACLVVSRVRYLLAMVILLQFVVSFLASRLTFPCPKLWRYLSEPPRSDATKTVYVRMWSRHPLFHSGVWPAAKKSQNSKIIY